MTTQFSPHFTSDEFTHDDPIPDECLPIFKRLCLEILEPMREQYGGPLPVTSGYRSAAANAAPETHGQPDSEHVATPDYCAGDVEPPTGARALFDWARNNPSLTYHQLILEHSPTGKTVIHVSINRLKPGIRSVKEGAIHNAAPYTDIAHVAYVPPAPESPLDG